MIIKDIKKYLSHGSAVLEASVKSDSEKKYNKIIYKFDKKYLNILDLNITPIAMAFLIPAMKLGEELYIEGQISKKFVDNTSKIMKLLHSWNVGFNPTKIHYKGVFIDTKITKDASASFFSLGVDSFYTYLKRAGTKKPISSLIFVHGFDISYQNKNYYNSALTKLKTMEKKEHVNVIAVSTNLKEVTDRYIEWDWEHGAAMASIATILGNKFNKIYFAGSDSWTQRKLVMPYGTHPKLDPLWSTEKMEVVHDGNEATRLQKIQKVVSKSDTALRYLRVCNQNLKGIYNCSNCEKCLRTMIDLQISGSLNKSMTFSHSIPLNKLRHIHNEDFDTKFYFEDSLKELKRQNIFPELQSAIEESLYRSNHTSYITKLIKFLSNLDFKYNNRRIFNYIFGLTKDGDRKRIFKFLSKISVIR